jgi:anthranilate/para-aminobenzoate synthase component I
MYPPENTRHKKALHMEWEETLNKRRAMFRAVALAEQTPD